MAHYGVGAVPGWHWQSLDSQELPASENRNAGCIS
jgi:hypothetical protein